MRRPRARALRSAEARQDDLIAREIRNDGGMVAWPNGAGSRTKRVRERRDPPAPLGIDHNAMIDRRLRARVERRGVGLFWIRSAVDALVCKQRCEFTRLRRRVEIAAYDERAGKSLPRKRERGGELGGAQVRRSGPAQVGEMKIENAQVRREIDALRDAGAVLRIARQFMD